MALQGPVFSPAHRDEFYSIIGARYAETRAEAAKIAAARGIRMAVEPFKPIHFGTAWRDKGYVLPIGDVQKTLLSNVAFFPYGILNLDEDFDYMKWYEGAKTDYIGDWFVLPVYYYQEQQGAYKGNLAHYNFRGDETFTISVHHTTQGFTASPDEEVKAWLLAFIALPATLKESAVVTGGPAGTFP